MAEGDEEFKKEDYGDAEEGNIEDEGGTKLLKTAYCEKSDCPNKQNDPAEEAWIKLMSAVPTVDQTVGMRAARGDDMMLPPEQDIPGIVKSIRPDPPNDFALQTTKEGWEAFRKDFAPIPEDLETGLKTLAEDWTGEDYDAFEEQVNTVIKNFNTVLKDIGEDEESGVIGQLKSTYEEIYSQQGGKEIVYPAPKFYLEETGCGSHKIHIRPPFFDHCEIFANDETKKAIELAGFDSNIYDEVHEGRQETYDAVYETYTQEYYQEHPEALPEGKTPSQLAEEAAQTRADSELEMLGSEGTEQYEQKASQVNGEITDRETSTDSTVSDLEPESEPSEQTTFNDGNTELDPPGGLNGGGAPSGPPDVGGTPPGDMTPPENPSTLTPPTNPPTDTTMPDSSLDEPSPWDESTGTDPDDLGGGLASGGGMPGGGGGGMPGGGGGGMPGGGAGAGAGAGGLGAGMGGMMGAGGMGGGKGAGAGAGGRGGGRGGGMGKGAGAGGRGMGGGMMGGGGRGMGGQGEGENGQDTWLVEDDDVWGIGNEDEDPYA